MTVFSNKKIIIFILFSTMIILLGFKETDINLNNEEYMHNMNLENEKNNYTEKYRPQFHFSTPEGRLADPNGLVYFKGEYHLFHQKMGKWAHAVSKDMVHWEHLPIALDHDELGQALSGSVVVDWNDSSGLFDGDAGLVAIYTNTKGGEAQSIAYSRDKGRTWERYDDNPVIKNPNIKDFRDPKVFWHEETEKWVMVVSTNQSVTFYNSSNLIDWERQSEFGNEEGSHVAVWETPDMFELPVDGDENNKKWVLHVSVGDNETTEGSTAQYFVGEFDGSEFVNDNSAETVLTTDYGQDYYAAQSFSDMPEEDNRRIWLGWMVNWRYPYQSPTYPWLGSMSIPRELKLYTTGEGEARLFQSPIQELEEIRATEYSFDDFSIEGTKQIKEVSGTNFEFEVEIEWDELDEFGIRLRQSENEETVFGIKPNNNIIFLDRTNAGLEQLTDRNGDPFQFGKQFKAELLEREKSIKLHGFVDESSIEIFVNDGEYVFTNLIYTTPTNNGIEFYTKGGSVNVSSFDFYHLNSIWRDVPNNQVERVVVSEQNIELEKGDIEEINANIKPDWLEESKEIEWEVEDPDIISVDQINVSQAVITGESIGETTIIVRDINSGKAQEIKVSVLDDLDSEYRKGWGPSPINGKKSGKWDVLDEFSIQSQVEYAPDWKEIFTDDVISGDFSVSADIQWLDQGQDGFPKYGITLNDEIGTEVSAFFNKDIHQLETFAKDQSGELGWEGVELPENIDFQEAQTLKIEKVGNTFSFYVNKENVYERTINIEGDVNVGLIHENTAAKFTCFSIEEIINYKDGWGPSPITGLLTGHWEINGGSNLKSLLGYEDNWTGIFREQLMHNDFSVSTDIKWIEQGVEGHPKYGIVLEDKNDTEVSAYLNKDLHELETFIKYKGKDMDWEGIQLPSEVNLQNAQNLKIEKLDNEVSFYFNDELLHKRMVEMKDEVGIGIVNINTKAEFNNFIVEYIDDDSDDNNEGSEENSGQDSEDSNSNNDEKLEDNEDENSENDISHNDDKTKEADKSDSEDNDEGNGHTHSDEHSLDEEAEDNKSNINDRNSSESNNNDDGSKLPSTSTDIYNLALFGLLLICTGYVIWYMGKKSKKNNKS